MSKKKASTSSKPAAPSREAINKAVEAAHLGALDSLSQARGDAGQHAYKFGKDLQREARRFTRGEITAAQLGANLESYTQDSTAGVGAAIRKGVGEVLACANGDSEAVNRWTSAEREVTRKAS